MPKPGKPDPGHARPTRDSGAARAIRPPLGGSVVARPVEDSDEETLLPARLVCENLGYPPAVARRYLGHGLNFDELVAAANLGLVQAALRYDPERNVKFVTYADWWIRKAIIEALETQSGPVRLPRYQYERLRQMRRARAAWTSRFCVEPTADQLAMAAGLPREEVERLLQLSPTITSLEQPSVPGGERPLKELLFDERAESPQGSLLRRDLTARLLRHMASLKEKELRVILLRFGLDGEPAQTLRDTGRQLGISRERVRQIEQRALVKLRCMF